MINKVIVVINAYKYINLYVGWVNKCNRKLVIKNILKIRRRTKCREHRITVIN